MLFCCMPNNGIAIDESKSTREPTTNNNTYHPRPHTAIDLFYSIEWCGAKMVFVFSSREQEAAAQQYPRDTYHATFVHDLLDDPTRLADDLAHQQPWHLDAFLPVLQHVPRLSNALPALLNIKRN
jgi:hypothetical protein